MSSADSVVAPALAEAAVDSGLEFTEPLTVADLKGAIMQCSTIKRTGVVLAWWLINAQRASSVDQIVADFQ